MPNPVDGARGPAGDEAIGPAGGVAVLVPAAGSGQRLGAGLPKALALIGGEPILVHAVRGLVAEPRVSHVVVAAPHGLERTFRDHATSAVGGRARVVVVTGGTTRAASVARALAEVPRDVEVVLVHDAARCLVPVEVIGAVIDAVRAGAHAAVPGLPVVDTIRQVRADGGSHTLDRSLLRAVQTPQGFPVEVLRRAHAAGDPGATDDAGMVEALGLGVVLVAGHPRGFKVTTAQDLVLAGAILAGEEVQ